MDRREFLKISMMTPAAGSLLLMPKISSARGTHKAAISGLLNELCYSGPPTGVISTTLKDLFKVGPAPSSPHTLAPIRIVSNFRQVVSTLQATQFDMAKRIEVRLFGSLSATGKGHRTDRAVIAGLLGEQPESLGAKLMDELKDTGKVRTAQIRGKLFEISGANIVWDRQEHDFPYVTSSRTRRVF